MLAEVVQQSLAVRTDRVGEHKGSTILAINCQLRSASSRQRLHRKPDSTTRKPPFGAKLDLMALRVGGNPQPRLLQKFITPWNLTRSADIPVCCIADILVGRLIYCQSL